MTMLPSWRQPMRVSDILTNAWAAYRPQLNDLVMMGAIASLPGLASTLLLNSVLIRLQAVTPETVGSVSSSDWLMLFGIGLPAALLEFFAVAAIYMAIVERVGGGEFSVVRSYLAALRRLPALFLAAIVGLLVPIALAITIIGLPVAIFLVISWVLVSIIVLAEGSGGIAALGRSRRLVKGSWWHTLNAVITVAFLTVFLPSIAVGLMQGLLSQALMGLVVNAFTTPFFAAAQVALYYDLRARKGEFLGPSQLGTSEPIAPGQST